MTTLTLSTFYLVSNRTINTISNGFALPVSTYIGQSIFGVVSIDNQTPIVIDINKLLNYATGVALTDTYDTVITGYLTNTTQHNVIVDYFPRVDVTTKKYDYRLEVFDISSATGWQVDIGDIDTPSIVSNLDMVGTLDDLVLTPPSGTVLSNILVSVNGILHRTSVYNDVIYVIDGFATIRQSGLAAICGLDTTSLGGHSVVPITSSNLITPADTYDSTVFIQDSTVDFTGKSVLLSLDGYLQVFNDIYLITDKSTIQLKTNRLDYVGNFIYSPILRSNRDAWNIRTQTNPYTGATNVVNEGLHQSDRNDESVYIFADDVVVDVDTLDSLAFLTTRLTSQHSFMIIINNPYVFTTEYTFYNKGEATMYECLSDDTPRGVLHYGRGYTLPYTTTFNLDTNLHLLFINTPELRSACYTTGRDNLTYPAPWADWQNETQRPFAKLIELCSGTNETQT